MPVTTLQIIIEAIDKASGTLGSIGKSFETTAKDFKKFGVGITAVGVGLGGLLVKTGMTAARVEVLGTVLESIGKVSGVSSDVLAEQEETIKKLGITTRSSRELLIKFMQSELDVADASKIARVAQDLAVISGQNSSEAAETLTNAIVSQNTMLLKQFGIVQSVTTIYSEYAEGLGKSVDELTEVEKKQAFLNSILTAGEKVAGTYEAAMGDVGKQMSSLARLTEEAEVSFGEAFLPVMEKVIKGLSDLLKWFEALSPETKEMITHAVMLGAALSLIVGPLLLIIGFLPTLAAGFSILLGPVGLVILAIMALIAIGVALWKNWDTMVERANSVKERIISAFQSLLNWFRELPGKIWNALKSIPGKIASVFKLPSLKLPSLPSWMHFQEGGIVPGVGPKLAVVHGGETVIPRGRGFGNINIYIQGGNYLDREAGEKFAEILGKMLRRELRY